jgi:hypothetical protein
MVNLILYSSSNSASTLHANKRVGQNILKKSSGNLEIKCYKII